MQMKSRHHLAVLGLLAALTTVISGCSSTKAPDAPAAAGDTSGVKVTGKNTSLFGFLKPYRIDIQQGNFVSKEMVAQLRPGQSRDQVRFVLGTPLLNNLFHGERWDYDFRLAKGNGEVMMSRVSVFFTKEGVVDHVEGGENLPTESEYLSLISSSKQGAKAVFGSDSKPEDKDKPEVKPASPVAPSSAGK